jgi:hypothetical protein
MVDSSFRVRLIVEKGWEFGKDTCLAFTDLEKAYIK